MGNPVLKWVKSSYSGNGACVEVAAGDHVLVRDTEVRHGPVLAFSPQAWRRFARRVKDGRASTFGTALFVPNAPRLAPATPCTFPNRT
jgi:Domain of unknown function (DUF397)